MPKTLTKTVEVEVYSFDELDDRVQERLLETWARYALDDLNDFDDTLRECITEKIEELGYGVSGHSVPLMNGKTRQEPDIYWNTMEWSGAFRGWVDVPKILPRYRKEKGVHLNTLRMLERMKNDGEYELDITIGGNRNYSSSLRADYCGPMETTNERHEAAYTTFVEWLTEDLEDTCRVIWKTAQAEEEYVTSKENLLETYAYGVVFTADGSTDLSVGLDELEEAG